MTLVLVGQPQLAERLNDERLGQLKQRIELRCTLSPFDLAETVMYIRNRVRIAGGDAVQMFTRDAIQVIHEALTWHSAIDQRDLRERPRRRFRGEPETGHAGVGARGLRRIRSVARDARRRPGRGDDGAQFSRPAEPRRPGDERGAGREAGPNGHQ